MNVTVGGLPGTGTTTLCALLRQRLGLPYTYAGQLFRAEAKRRSMGLGEFGRLCEEDPQVDQALDARQLELLEQGGQLLEGRLAGWLAHRHGIAALKVWLVCDEEERMRRIVDRDGGSVQEQRERIERRERSEAQRYRAYYGADLDDLSRYDVVLDSTDQESAVLADRVVAAFRQRVGDGL